MVTREVPLEKNMDIQFIQVNARKSVTRMTKRRVNVRTDKIGREYLDALSA